jgi:glycosyltransferase involved in cell wall biosynthesis
MMPDIDPTPTTVRSARAWLASRSRGPLVGGSVLVHAPSAAFQEPGGGENQLVQTGRHLEELGVRVQLFSPWRHKLKRARLLHLFGMSREGLELARIAKARGVPIAISPICWYEPRALWALEPRLGGKLIGLAGWALRRSVSGLPGWRAELLSLADAILPNSVSEARQLEQLFGADPSKIRVVPNGVMASMASVTPDRFQSEFGSKPFVLTVGRIEPRKNLLGLIQAIRPLGLRLIVIGAATAGQARYESQCREAGRGFVTWLGRMDPHDPLLASAFAAARVFALPSWFETPSLAALEAGLTGCAVVITPYGSTRDYFSDLVHYARPHRHDEIKRAVADCWDHGPEPQLAARIAGDYLWPRVARLTSEVYDQIAS